MPLIRAGVRSIEAPVQDVPATGAIVGGKYRVDGVLGVGGMGVVLAATHVHLRERVALKLVRKNAADGVAYERFVREARVAGRIRSEHVARVFDLGISDDGRPFIAMGVPGGGAIWRRSSSEEGRLPSRYDDAVTYALHAIEGGRRGARPRRHPPGPQAGEPLPHAPGRRLAVREGARLRDLEDHGLEHRARRAGRDTLGDDAGRRGGFVVRGYAALLRETFELRLPHPDPIQGRVAALHGSRADARWA